MEDGFNTLDHSKQRIGKNCTKKMMEKVTQREMGGDAINFSRSSETKVQEK